MLESLRQGANSWVAKGLLILLVISFAIWGVSGQFAGYGAGTLASVGDEEVTVADYASVQDRLERSGRQVSPEQLLNQLLLDAAVDDEARSRNFGMSEDRVAAEIADDPNFRGADGQFDREQFQSLLQNSGIDRDDYVRDIRQNLVRNQITSSIAAGIDVPRPLVEALYQFQNEERAVSSIVVDQSAIEPVAPPDDAALQAYFDANTERFRAPEYRKLGLLVLDPASLADPASVTDAEIAAEYERRKPSFTRPERRRIEQIRFDAREAAEQAMASIRAPEDFASLAATRNVAPADLDQGLKTQAEILDPAIAEAAFAATPNTVFPVLDNAIEPSIIRVTEVEPGAVSPLAEVAPRLREELAGRLARERITEIYDKVEDERAGGSTLEEISKTMPLPFRVIEAVAKDGAAPDGSAVPDLPAKDQLLTEAYESDVGVENNPIRSGSEAFVFHEVLEIIPERERSLVEVRDQALAAWTAEETEKRINERAEALLARLRSGEPIEALAAEIGKPVQVVENLKRGAAPAGMSANAAAQAFAGPEGYVVNAESDTPPARVLLRVDRVTAPAYFAEAADARAIKEQLVGALRNDILQSYYRQLLQARETRINNAAYAQLTGSNQAQ